MHLIKLYFRGVLEALLASIFLKQVCQGAKHNQTRYERLLFEDLFRDYSKEIRPVLNYSEAVEVKFGMSLSELLDLDEKGQTLTTNVWIRQKWNDMFLRWNRSLYGGIKSITIDPIHIWKPDIILHNNVHDIDNGEQYLFKTKVTITHDGTVAWYSLNKLRTSCNIDITYFPFDTQDCKLVFGSWAFHGHEIKLQFLNNNSRKVDMTKFTKNGEWDIVSTKGIRNNLLYPCCPMPFYDITYHIVIKRRPLFYLNNLILPCIVLALLTSISFLFPPETGERIAFVVTVLLGMTVFMIVFTDFIPATSEVTPLISKYFIAVLVEVALCLLATCVPLRLQHLHSGTEMPRWAKVLIFDYLGYVMCWRSRPRSKLIYHVAERNGTINKGNTIELSVEGIEKGNIDENHVQSYGATRVKRDNPENGVLSNDVSAIQKYVHKKEREGELYAEWKNAIAILDRLFFWLFIITFTASSITMLMIP